MDNIVKKLYIGSCYVCGKPIREDDMYGTMEDSDTLYCKACWNEYAERCDALMEQMKKEKAEQSGQAADTSSETLNARKQERTEVDLEIYLAGYFSGWYVDEDLGLVKPDCWSCIVDDLKDIARHFYELGLNARKEE